MAALAPCSCASLSKDPFSIEKTTTFSGCKVGKGGTQQTQLRFLGSFKRSNTILDSDNCATFWIDYKTRPGIKLKASTEPPQLVEELKSELESLVQMESGSDLFDEIKHQFLSFKRQKYMENLEHYQNLAKCQAPKFLVIACADSRVCSSYILGFEPGEAFVVRNVANMVPPFENVPSETKAALEFAVNSLEVHYIDVFSFPEINSLKKKKREREKLSYQGKTGHLCFHFLQRSRT